MKGIGLLVFALACFLTFASNETSAQTVSGPAVKNAIETYLKQFSSPSAETVLEFEDLKPEYSIAFRDYSLSVTSVNSVTKKGLVTFLVKVRDSLRGDGSSETIPVTVKIRTFQEVLVATQTIKPHCEIGTDEVSSIKTESTEMANPVTELGQLKGKWTSGWIQSGRALTFDMFDDEPVVKRGDDVMIVFKTKNVVVRELGSALQDGKLNEIIRVTNEYKDNLRGKVTGKGEVVLVN